MKGFTNKQPKIVAACVGVLTRGLRYIKLSLITATHLINVLFVTNFCFC